MSRRIRKNENFSWSELLYEFNSDDGLSEEGMVIWKSPFIKASVILLVTVVIVLLFSFGAFALVFGAIAIAILATLLLVLMPFLKISAWFAKRNFNKEKDS
jgi:hypothetical protein